MSKYIVIDFETRSLKLIKNPAQYFDDPSFEVICLSYIIDGESYVVPYPTNIPPRIKMALSKGYKFIAHNYMFEEQVFEKLGWKLPAYWTDTMAIASYYNLPRSLKKLAERLLTDIKKDAIGNKLIEEANKKKKSKYYHEKITGKLLEDMMNYCKQDTLVTEQCYLTLGDLPEFEQEVFKAHQDINRRGHNVNIELAKNFLTIWNEFKSTELNAIADIEGAKPNSPQWLRAFCKSKGLIIPDIKKETLDKIDLDCVDPDVKRLINVRKNTGKSSIAKPEAIFTSARNGRIRYSFQYALTVTNRWSATGLQIHNMPKPVDKLNIEDTLKAINNLDINGVKIEADKVDIDIGSALVSCFRAMIIPDEGKIFVSSDFGQIEARILGWLAEDELMLKVFADKEGPDIYQLMAGKVYNCEPKKVNSKQRSLGKTIILACGYQMGAAQFKIRLLDAKINIGKLGIDPGEALAQLKVWGINPFDKYNKCADDKDLIVLYLVQKYRKTFHKVEKLWKDLYNGSIQAIQNPNEIISINDKIAYTYDGHYLVLIKPNDKYLYYPKATIGEGKYGKQAVFFTHDSKITELNPPILTNNVVQSVARDRLAEILIRANKNPNFEVVAHIHDEILVQSVAHKDVVDTKRICEQLSKVMMETEYSGVHESYKARKKCEIPCDTKCSLYFGK